MFISSTYQQKIKNIIIFFSIFLTPSLFLYPQTEPFEYIKMWFLSNLLLIYSFLTISSSKYINFKIDNILIIIFLSVQTLNLFFSTNFSTSFFGNFYHFSYSYIFIFALCFFYLTVEKNDIKISNILNILLLSSIPSLIYALIQIFKLDFISWNLLISTNRVSSTFGQPNLYAQYLSIILIIAIYLFFSTKKYIYTVLLLIVFYLLLQTQSLSTFISIFVTLLIGGFYFLKKTNLKSILVILLVLFLAISLIVFKNHTRITEQLWGGKIENTVTTNDTAKIRFILWKEALNQIDTKKFIIGSGEETFGISFIRKEVFNKTSEWGFIYNKPHNYFIENFFEGGIINLIFMLLIFTYTLLKIKNNFLSSVPFFIILSSIFLYISAYAQFIIFIFLKLITNSPKIYTIKIKNVVWVFISIIFILNNIFFISILFYYNSPCISYRILKFIPNYQVSCSVKNNDLGLMLNGITSSKYDRILEEKILLFLLQKNYLNEADNVIKIWERKSVNDPIVIYYRGLYFEKVGLLDKAKIEFKKADKLVPNFFVVKSKLENYQR